MNCCTYKLSGPNYTKQNLYICHTCKDQGKFEENEGVCEYCTRECHPYHDLELIEDIDSFCDCGAQYCCIDLDVMINSTLINNFAIKLFQTDEFKVFSPLSIIYALSLLHLGSEGQTHEELTQLFEGSLDQKQLNTIQNILHSVMSNWIILNKNKCINQEYENLITNLTSCIQLNFSIPQITQDINDLISTSTKGMLDNVVDNITPDMVFILLNIIHFKAFWTLKFSIENTVDDVFHGPKGDINVKMMQQENSFEYYEDDVVQILELPYECDNYSMIIFLPRENNGQYIFDLSYLEQMYSSRVNVHIPRFTIHQKCSLKDTLEKLGVNSLFDPNNTGLNKISDGLYISKAIHETKIIVDEEGTEAVAVTLICTSRGFCRVPVFTADHPFIFCIRHNSTGIIMFMGLYDGE